MCIRDSLYLCRFSAAVLNRLRAADQKNEFRHSISDPKSKSDLKYAKMDKNRLGPIFPCRQRYDVLKGNGLILSSAELEWKRLSVVGWVDSWWFTSCVTHGMLLTPEILYEPLYSVACLLIIILQIVGLSFSHTTLYIVGRWIRTQKYHTIVDAIMIALSGTLLGYKNCKI